MRWQPSHNWYITQQFSATVTAQLLQRIEEAEAPDERDEEEEQ